MEILLFHSVKIFVQVHNVLSEPKSDEYFCIDEKLLEITWQEIPMLTPANNEIFKMSLSVILNTNFSTLPNGKLLNEARLIFFNENRR